jgi:hypothetical protein
MSLSMPLKLTFRTNREIHGFEKPFRSPPWTSAFAWFEPSPRPDDHARRKRLRAERVHAEFVTALSSIVFKTLLPLASTTFHANLPNLDDIRTLRFSDSTVSSRSPCRTRANRTSAAHTIPEAASSGRHSLGSSNFHNGLS